jgi:hypothetical protein
MSARIIRHEGIIFAETELNTYILLMGTAELSHLYGPRSRVLAILSPGVPLMAQQKFQWTALNDCRVAEPSTEIFIST